MKLQGQVRTHHILLGATLVGTGAFAAIYLPQGLAGFLAILALMRICWLEDNISSDLFGKESLPQGYRNTAKSRRILLMRWFGIWREESAAEGSAHLMATAMRTEVQVWASALLGMAAVLVAQYGPFEPLVNFALAAAVFWVALARVDRLAVSLVHCEACTPLPDTLLLPSGRR